MNLKIQDYLLVHSATQLAREHGIFVHPAKDGIAFSCNYGQIESKETDPLTWECRGLVLARKGGTPYTNMDETVGETVVLARPFNRFFNHGSTSAANVDFLDPETVFWEKVDGTLGVLYFNPFKKEWHIATRAVPEADVPMNDTGLTFSQLFKKCLVNTAATIFDDFVTELSPYMTYCFEICSPDNNVVVQYNDYRLFFLGARDRMDGTEYSPKDSAVYNVFHIPVPRSFSFTSLEEATAYINKFGPTELEGLVVCDKNFNRVKIKTTAYLAFARTKQGLGSTRSFLDLILLEKQDDVAPLLCQEWQDRITELASKLHDTSIRLDEGYRLLYNEDRKTFALAVQKAKYPIGYFMDRWQGRSASFIGWAKSKKNKDGEFSNTALDSILDILR